ncbi:unnamed protein product [Rotaria socialis]|uniref:EGF-like domain-containing protein n=1 Tax=Rotaria socialis TaxID=392032 RepID=A0A819Z9Q6_9BILA|nr:unnamed protein product [Rotaria socialis]CAF4167445.1 unnamed protein product [Rotaria socialis]
MGIFVDNRSICICPNHKFGRRCLLTNTIGHIHDNSTCQHGGQCIPADQYIVPEQQYHCICPQGQSICENAGQCFQDTPDGPHRSIYIFSLCYYGTRCQFRTSGLGLLPDGTLGYHMIPHVRLLDQPRIVTVSLVLTLVFRLIGYIDDILTLITFTKKTTCEIACGLYPFGSSIITILTTMVFALKFWIKGLYIKSNIFTNSMYSSRFFSHHGSMAECMCCY